MTPHPRDFSELRAWWAKPASQWRLGCRAPEHAGRLVWLLAQPQEQAGISVQGELCVAAAAFPQALLVSAPPQAAQPVLERPECSWPILLPSLCLVPLPGLSGLLWLRGPRLRPE